MAKRTLLRQRAWGEAILERLDEMYVAPELARHVRAFKAAHGALEAATKRATAARERRDTALSALGRADGTLERALVALEKRLVAASTGGTKEPRFRPARILALEPARAAMEIARLAQKLSGPKTPPPVKKAVGACTEAARAVTSAVTKADAAQKAYAETLSARDALLHKWTTALARLRRRAEDVWREAPDDVARVFAAPSDEEPETIFDLKPVLPNVMNGVHTS